MEIWSTGPFDNEEAREIIEDLQADQLFIDELLPDSGHRYIEKDQGAVIVALAHMAAGHVPDSLSQDCVAKLQDDALKARLRDSLGAVLIDATVSGLYAYWEDQGSSLVEWKSRSYVQL